MNQLVSPNLNAVGVVAECLAYVSRGVFSNPAPGTTAWNAWAVCNQQPNQNFPTGVYFPIWFSYYTTISGVYGNFGHVAVMTPSGEIYSSPWQLGTTHAVLPNITELIRIYSNNGQFPMAYVGWSPDVLNLNVIGDSMVVSQSAAEKIVTYFYRLGTGQYPTPGQADYWVPRVRDVATGIDELGTALLASQVPPIPSDYVAYSGPTLYVPKS